MLNKQGPGKIDWTDYTWNPIAGRCQHNCSYCYMHNMWNRFPELAKNQLKESYLKKNLPLEPSKIFVGSSTDMLGDWVPTAWINQVLGKASWNPDHIFQFLTKNPDRYSDFDLEALRGFAHCWLGTTVDGTEKTASNIAHLLYGVPHDFVKFVSFEPMIENPSISINEFSELDWVIIGADSSRGAEKAPTHWANTIISLARSYNIPVWVKDNYGYPETIKEFPDTSKNQKGMLA